MTNEPEASLDGVIEHLARWRTDAFATLELLTSYRQHVVDQASALENPQAVIDYIDLFAGITEAASSACARIADEVTREAGRAQVDALRAMAAQGVAEQPRCLVFRDKWINKPLPQERMRPLLNDISVTTRDQLTAFRDLNKAADMLEGLTTPGGPPPDEKKGFDRRALFTRLFKT